ncbi:MAG: hypothetical protein HY619_01455 [Thaumarchaeota archaeon]|nr:hypothetical protein [Nitrososphaerota archaeon]
MARNMDQGRRLAKLIKSTNVKPEFRGRMKRKSERLEAFGEEYRNARSMFGRFFG